MTVLSFATDLTLAAFNCLVVLTGSLSMILSGRGENVFFLKLVGILTLGFDILSLST